MASVIPGGGAQIVIPDDAMNELAEAIRRIKGLQPSIPKPTKSLAPRKALKLPTKNQVTRRPK
jgi:hypothetical protein